MKWEQFREILTFSSKGNFLLSEKDSGGKTQEDALNSGCHGNRFCSKEYNWEEKCGDLGGRIAGNIFAFSCLMAEAENTAYNYVKQPTP